MVFSMVFMTSFHNSFSTRFSTVFSQILAKRVRLGARETLMKMILPIFESLRLGALKAINGLFVIAYRKDGTVRCFFGTCAYSCEKFVCQMLDNFPLFGGGILGFVYKNMVNFAI